MNTTEIRPLTEEAVARLLETRRAASAKGGVHDRRKVPRWPFPGTVELWIPDEDGTERYALATSLDLSAHGVGVRCDEELTPDMELAVAIHEPETSFHGRAVVRHCTRIENEYLAGLQFVAEGP